MQKISKLALVALAALLPETALAQSTHFSPGWVLDAGFSELQFQTSTNNSGIENHTFSGYSGHINENGQATITIDLETIDTRIDQRDVRLQFIFFEVFSFPTAIITAQIAPQTIAGLAEERQKLLDLPVTITMHGVTINRNINVLLFLLDDNTVSISTEEPIEISISDFEFGAGLANLERVAELVISPRVDVSFDVTFHRAGSVAEFDAATTVLTEPVEASLEQPESGGDFSNLECISRFEVLSFTDNINFNINSARLTQSSAPLLNSIVDIIQRCPALIIRVEGHTDSDGSSATNQNLSQRRAEAVVAYLVSAGIDTDRLSAIGYGEAQPLVPNTTRANKRINRRIEFVVAQNGLR